MKEPGFALEIQIRATPEQVLAFLADLRNYLPIHPLFESVTEVAARPVMPGARFYEVVDRVPFGPLRLRTPYTAALERVGDREIRGRAWQAMGIEVLTDYRVEALPAGAHVFETVTIKAPLLIRRFVSKQARAAHERTLGELKRLLETNPLEESADD